MKSPASKPKFSLFGEIDDTPKLQSVPLALIAGDPNQPRQFFEEASLQELATSIAQKGLLHAPLVRPNPSGEGYLVVAGERRVRAAKLAGLSEIDVKLCEEEDYATLALIENLQREDLKPVEEARGISKVLSENASLTQAELATQLGVSRTSLTMLLKILTLPETILNESLERDTPKTILIELAQLTDNVSKLTLWEKGANLTVADIRNFKIKPSKSTPKPSVNKTWHITLNRLEKGKITKADVENLQALQAKITAALARLEV